MVSKTLLSILIMLYLPVAIHAQETKIIGSVQDELSNNSLPDVRVIIENTFLETKTDANGEFTFALELPLGNQTLRVEKMGYLPKRFPIIIREGETVDLRGLTLEYDVSVQKELFVISLSDNQLNSEEDSSTENMSGLLQSSRDVFLNAVAYDFSSTFFKTRGLDNSNGKILINGIEMNKQFDGRPQWANWGGLNDAQRNQEFTMGMGANDYTFGDLAGTSNFIMRASKYVKGGRFSLANANRSYQGRIMASYNSGLNDDGWAYSILASRRFGEEGYVEGTLYDANSIFTSIEKNISKQHSINVLAIYAQNRRGRSAAITEEVYKLKGDKYNPFWGLQNGEARNSRIREVNEPILMLNHYWNLNQGLQINTNLMYQFGKTGNTRIDSGGTNLSLFNGQETYIGGGRNTDPSYYQYLPSYFFRNSGNNPNPYNYEQAYLAGQNFVNDGQLDWSAIYRSNVMESENSNNSIYILQEDRTDDSRFTANSILDYEISETARLNSSITYSKLTSENFAMVNDLLGGSGFLDVDFFAEETGQNTEDQLENIAQSNLQNRNRIVKEGDKYKYDYIIDATFLSAFSQIQVKSNNYDFYFGGNASSTSYQREGLYENGNFPGNASYGKGTQQSFFNFGLKSGITYKITGRHLLDLNASYITKAPTIRNSFENVRQNNRVVDGLRSEKIYSADFGYNYRSPTLKARATAYFSQFKDGTDIGFYFTEDLAGLGFGRGDAFVQEILTEVDRRNFGIELGAEYQLTTTIKIKAVAAVGQFTYSNNPKLYLTSDDFEGRLSFGDGRTNLKNLHVAGGPEKAYQMGFEYRDPNYWWFGATCNYFSNSYLDIGNLIRSANFSSDFDGQTINNIDPETAQDLLEQEQFDHYILVNLVGGKSWLIKKYYLGFFASINNILNQEYKTGGFEQSRLANYQRLKQDVERPNGRIFGPRYYYGNGTTYYLNLYIRF